MHYEAINKGCWEHLQPDEIIKLPGQGLKRKNAALGLKKGKAIICFLGIQEHQQL